MDCTADEQEPDGVAEQELVEVVEQQERLPELVVLVELVEPAVHVVEQVVVHVVVQVALVAYNPVLHESFLDSDSHRFGQY